MAANSAANAIVSHSATTIPSPFRTVPPKAKYGGLNVTGAADAITGRAFSSR
jgi:hypothetical protein